MPGMYEAQFRADTVYTGEITTAVWIDPLLLRVGLVPGLTEPGGTWPHPPYTTPAEVPSVLAAFNGGFRFADAHGGFYLDGRAAVPLRPGATSLVIDRDGRVDVGTWGAQVTMTPDVVAVLQNLVLMVDGGQVAPSATYNDTRIWGNTLGGSVVVARSGIGVTATGGLVYVAGPALTARTLAEALQRAGAVRAMTVDINPEWVTFNFYTHPDPADPSKVVASKRYPQMQRPATRYLPPTSESRDFFTVSLSQGG
ncbi:MAG: phosphodiester glycosidase family protein [Candidatus Dormibacteria bacterium]